MILFLAPLRLIPLSVFLKKILEKSQLNLIPALNRQSVIGPIYTKTDKFQIISRIS